MAIIQNVYFVLNLNIKIYLKLINKVKIEYKLYINSINYTLT
jgi:hypothetical protein